MNGLKGKKILVTAGPTPVPVDEVRIWSNVFTGTTGYDIAVLAAEKGAHVVLLLGPHHIEKAEILAGETRENILIKFTNTIDVIEKIEKAGGGLVIVKFQNFIELMALMKKHISSGNFNAVIHSAAVADYAPIRGQGKIKSNLEELVVRGVQTPKIISRIKGWDPRIFLVQFKLEVGLREEDLIETAWQSLKKYRSDLVVANNKEGTSITTVAAYIIDRLRQTTKAKTREEMYEMLLEVAAKKI